MTAQEMPRTEWGYLVDPGEFDSWILRNDDELLVLNKPSHLVCHPSKKGPWSSLVGAAREHLGVDRLHMISRLDRETSGLVLMAKSQSLASQLQSAIQQRGARKEYVAILEGEMREGVTVSAAIGPDLESEFVARQWISEEAKESVTVFDPVAIEGGFTWARIRPITGRRHQIRVHASSIGHPVVGDKLYGADPGIMLRFISEGVTPEMMRTLKLDRHALHAERIAFPEILPRDEFCAPVSPDLLDFWRRVSNGSVPA